ncbi:MAG TPA: hypothetical protein VGM75_18240 [Pseudonocardiaceae bacterium]|jgi:hypothetical protein
MRLNELRIDTGERHSRAETQLFIDGVDLLDSQRFTVRSDGSTIGDGRTIGFRPTDPVGLLPPDSRVLLPSAIPTSAMVGICSCGESGCGSLYLRVRRDGDVVLWEPEPNPPHHTVNRTWRFDLRQYLDAIDAGAATMTWAPRPVLLARELRRRRDNHWGFSANLGALLLDVRAWPGVEEIKVLVADHHDAHWRTIAVPENLTDQEIIDSLRTVR